MRLWALLSLTSRVVSNAGPRVRGAATRACGPSGAPPVTNRPIVLGLGVDTPVGDDEVPGAAPAVKLGAHVAIGVAAGDQHTCALFDDGSVRCWGLGLLGQLVRSEWGKYLGDTTVTAAILDRLAMTSVRLDIDGPSYRQHLARQRAESITADPS